MADILSGLGTQNRIPQYSWGQFPQQGQKPGQIPVQEDSVFAGLSPTSSQMQQGWNVAGDMMSGAAYAPYESQAQEAFARAAKNLRGQTGGAYAPQIGQGAAVRAQQGAEQGILEGMGETMRGIAADKQAMQERGLGALQGMAQTGMQLGQYQTGEWQTAWNDALLYNDPTDARGLAQLQSMFEQRYGYRPDMQELINEREYIRTKREQDVTTGGLTIESMKAQLGDQNFNSIMTMINSGATQAQINDRFGAGTISTEEYSSMRDWSDSGKWQSEFEQRTAEWTEETKLRWADLKQNRELALAGITSAETIAGMQISSNERVAGMQIDSAEKIAAWRNEIESRGMTLNEAALYGTMIDTDGDGAVDTRVMGTMEIAAKELGLAEEGVSIRRASVFGGMVDTDGDGVPDTQMAGSLENMSEQTRMQAVSMFGGWYDADGDGEKEYHEKGTLDIEADNQQLREDMFDFQKIEIYGGMIDTDGDGKVDTEVKGKYDYLDDDQKMRADELYGYDVDSLGNREGDPGFMKNDPNMRHVNGSLEIENDKITIQQTLAEAQERGIDLQQDALYGFNHPVTGRLVTGTAEMAERMFVLESKTVKGQMDEIYGYTKADGTVVKGKYELMNDAEKRASDELYGAWHEVTDPSGRKTSIWLPGTLNLQQQAVNIQKQGLTIEEAKVKGFQGRDANGNSSWIPGTSALANEQLIQQGDALYGYTFDAEGRRYGDPDFDEATATHTKGSIEIAAEDLGLRADNVELARSEIYGFWNPETSEWQAGKYETMSNELKIKAQELFGGYYMDDKGEFQYYPGEFGTQKALLDIQVAAGEKNIKLETTLQMVLGMLEGDDPAVHAQAADIIYGIAEDLGIDVGEIDSAKPVNPEGFPGAGPLTISQATDVNMMMQNIVKTEKTFDSGVGAGVYDYKAVELPDAITLKAISNAILNGTDLLPNTNDTSIEDIDMLKYKTKDGKRRWVLNDEAEKWLKENKNKFYRSKSGKVYYVLDTRYKAVSRSWKVTYGSKYSSEAIQFLDLETGSVVLLSNKGGSKGEQRSLPS